MPLLPKQFYAELDLPGGGGGTGNDSGSGRDAGGGENDQVRSVEVGAVEQVEYFRPGLQVEAAAEGCVLECGEIPGSETGAGERVATQVAIEAAAGRRSEECRRVAASMDLPVIIRP